MEETLSLQSGLYPKITPAGAYYAVSGEASNASRTLLFNIMKADSEEAVSNEKMMEWAQTESPAAALNLLYRLQRLEFLYGDETGLPQTVDFNDEQLSHLVASLSSNGKGLLVGTDGAYFANAGFHHEAAEEIGLLALKIGSIENEHRLLIRNNLHINHSAWGICDPSGQSELTFFPVHIGSARLMLVLSGVPDLNKDEFVTLVKALCCRYDC